MKRVRDGKKSSNGPKEKLRKSKAEKKEKSDEKRDAKETELNKLKISDIDFDEETLAALPKNCKPIWYFMDDRKEMVDQIFSAIQESSLQKMIPKELKNYEVEEIKNMCLEQLMSMSDDHVLYILAGGDPDSFIEKNQDVEVVAEIDSKSDIKHKKEETSAKDQQIYDKKRSSLDKEDEKKPKRSPMAINEDECPSAEGEVITLHPSPIDLENLNEDSVMSLVTQGGGDMGLDMLELVMRAKAIRALLEEESSSIPEMEDSDWN